MKLYFLPIVCSLGLLPLSQHTSAFSDIGPVAVAACDEVPELNKKIIDYVNTQIGKKVGRGECWDLAANALNTTSAAWDKEFKYGRQVNLKKECVFPGDIMQFEDVVIEYTKGKTMYKEKMAQHTAIIYEVKGEGEYIIADQNTTQHGRKVGLSPLNLKTITKGKYLLYRPEKK